MVYSRSSILIQGIKLDNYGSQSQEYQDWKRGIFHDIISSILQPLYAVMNDGVNLLCPDNERRHCFPVLAQYIADYEEQRVLTSIVSGNCVKCTLPSFRANVGSGINSERTVFPPRIQQEASELRALHDKEILHKQFGLKPTHPFTKNIPRCDIHDLMAMDILHGVSKCFFDYVHTKWIIPLIELDKGTAKARDEINARFSNLSPFRRLKSFRNGISCLPRWTGAEYKAMSKVYLGVIAGLVPNEAIMMVKEYLDIQRLAHYESHTESTLKLLDKAVKGFWNQLMLPDGPFVTHDLVKTGWYCPKLHCFRHYTQNVREKGVLPFCSTDRTEPYHRPIKDSYRASNRGAQAGEFILRDEARDFGWEIWYQDLKRLVLQRERNESDSDGPREMMADEEPISEGELEVTQSIPRSRIPIRKEVSLSKKRRYKGFREISIVARQYDLEHLKEAAHNYLVWIRGNRQPLRRKRRLSEISFQPRLDLKVSDSLAIRYPAIHDEYVPLNDVIYSTPAYPYFQNKDWIKKRYRFTISIDD